MDGSVKYYANQLTISAEKNILDIFPRNMQCKKNAQYLLLNKYNDGEDTEEFQPSRLILSLHNLLSRLKTSKKKRK